jgi:hypothetical protein
MKIKSWPLLLVCAIIFTIATVYWLIANGDDTIGVGIFAFAAILSFIGGLGNWKSNK